MLVARRRSFIRVTECVIHRVNGFAFQYFQKGIVFVNVKAQYRHINNATEQHHMTYEEAAQHLEISPAEARREIEKQGEDWQEFVDTFGVQSVYYSDDVLEWLGW